MKRSAIFLTLCLSLAMPLTRAGESDGRSLFNGKDLEGWMSGSGKPPSAGWVAEDGTLTLKKGGGYLWTKERFGDFVLSLEFKTTGNSGIFIRTAKPSDPVQTGIEIQVDNPSAKPGKHSLGSFYDLVAPKSNPAKKGEWVKMVITAKDNILKVEMNGEVINEMDLNRWTEAGKNPDGTKNKYRTALKDFSREGHIGFQDHGAPVQYRHIRIRPLGKS